MQKYIYSIMICVNCEDDLIWLPKFPLHMIFKSVILKAADNWQVTADGL